MFGHTMCSSNLQGTQVKETKSSFITSGPFVVIRPGLTQQPQKMARDEKLHIQA